MPKCKSGMALDSKLAAEVFWRRPNRRMKCCQSAVNKNSFRDSPATITRGGKRRRARTFVVQLSRLMCIAPCLFSSCSEPFCYPLTANSCPDACSWPPSGNLRPYSRMNMYAAITNMSICKYQEPKGPGGTLGRDTDNATNSPGKASDLGIPCRREEGYKHAGPVLRPMRST